jgi:tight adherence protein B
VLLNLIPLGALRHLALILLGSSLPLALLARYAEAERALTRYEARLSRHLLYLRLRITARRVVCVQAALLSLGLLALSLRSYGAASLLAASAFSASPWLTYQRSRRTTLIEAQLDGWLFGLASTMRATPAPGQAIAYSAALVSSPLRDELETLVKEQRLGTSLDEALARMGARIGSRAVQSALGTLRIGQLSGGDIPEILERSAATLREMARLEGVVRTKTAESKAQAWLLAILPFPLVALLNWLDPGFLSPLLHNLRGSVVIALALLLWVSSILVARRILDVDI